jgi:DNA-binding response OmpR family regulator
VLVVEDSRTQAQWLARVLEGEGYQVQVAMDGREAIHDGRQYSRDLVEIRRRRALPRKSRGA